MEQVVPWTRLTEVIEPHYPKSGKRGRPPIRLECMLRMYFVQQWYGLADEAVEDAIYDSQALRQFLAIDLRQRWTSKRYSCLNVIDGIDNPTDDTT